MSSCRRDRLRAWSKRLVFACAFSLAAPGLGLATRAPAVAADAAATGSALPVPPARTVVTHHVATIAGREVRYTATAGTMLLTAADGDPTASVFYVAYTADDLGPHARRPLTFSYNGGPGGSSALVHMGAFGPRTVVTTNASATHPPPYEIVDNANSLLDVSDLVFVDAVGTGFSRLAGKGTAKDYYGVDQDGRAFAQFVRRYITANDRWNSPKYVAGESYGTTRSCVLANMLQDDGIALNGVILISSVLDFATLGAQPGDDLPYWLYLPTEAAVAVYQHKATTGASDLPAYLRSVRAFAQGPYAAALAKGAALEPAERDAVARTLAADTGLPLEYVVRSNLRVRPGRFEKTLLGDTARTVGRYDGRFTNFDIDPVADAAETDPSSDAVTGAFTASFNRYVREELNYRTDEEYKFLSYDVNNAWDWNRGGRSRPSAANVSGDLRDAMTANPFLRVFSANGIYDLATPFFATEYSLAHLGIAPELQAHITFGYYPAGHMIYLNPEAHAQLKADLAAFYR
jgi:carboxypeptidase C (cathepsin A)